VLAAAAQAALWVWWRRQYSHWQVLPLQLLLLLPLVVVSLLFLLLLLLLLGLSRMQVP
jgi:hypothetical protein